LVAEADAVWVSGGSLARVAQAYNRRTVPYTGCLPREWLPDRPPVSRPRASHHGRLRGGRPPLRGARLPLGRARADLGRVRRGDQSQVLGG
jgi:hypothetical protein